jgi:hypothetical protein
MGDLHAGAKFSQTVGKVASIGFHCGPPVYDRTAGVDGWVSLEVSPVRFSSFPLAIPTVLPLEGSIGRLRPFGAVRFAQISDQGAVRRADEELASKQQRTATSGFFRECRRNFREFRRVTCVKPDIVEQGLKHCLECAQLIDTRGFVAWGPQPDVRLRKPV